MKKSIVYYLPLLLLAVMVALLFTACTQHQHVYGEWTVEKDATCAEAGSKVRVCACGQTDIEVIPAIDHTEGEWIEDASPTCTEGGARHQVCAVCNATVRAEYPDATGHSEGEWTVIDEPTCTKKGKQQQSCTVCGEVLSTKSIPTLSHTDSDWQIDIEADCTTQGLQHKYCTVCFKKTVEEVIPFAHNFVDGVCECGEPKPSEGLTFVPKGNGYALVGIGTCTDTYLVIPSTYNNRPVIAIENSGDARDNLSLGVYNKVYIPASVKEIGSAVFDRHNITAVIFAPGSQLKTIERCAFQNNPIVSLHLPEGLETIEDAVFLGCTELKEIYFPSTLKTIGSNNFREAEKIEKILIGDIAAWCNVTFKNKYSHPILNNSSAICDAEGNAITHLVIPEGVTSISTLAFIGASLTDITFPSTLSSIGEGAFDECGDVRIHIADLSAWCSIAVGKDGLPDAKWYYEGEELVHMTVPENVQSIGAYAFSNCTSLVSVTMGDKITHIGEGAFYSCDSLESITLSANLSAIPDKFVYGCVKLSSMDIPVSVTTIGTSAFFNCKSMTRFHIPEGVNKIGANAFENCTGITEISFANTKGWEAMCTIGTVTFYSNYLSTTSGILEYIDEWGFVPWERH